MIGWSIMERGWWHATSVVWVIYPAVSTMVVIVIAMKWMLTMMSRVTVVIVWSGVSIHLSSVRCYRLNTYLLEICFQFMMVLKSILL
jgi:hypothetical protein